MRTKSEIKQQIKKLKDESDRFFGEMDRLLDKLKTKAITLEQYDTRFNIYKEIINQIDREIKVLKWVLGEREWLS
ncbi:MAG: hypothetical protein GXO75_19050 [Calditrichaeota bacterium]|nr:hypothetical protein [Calditrichota bacterium]